MKLEYVLTRTLADSLNPLASSFVDDGIHRLVELGRAFRRHFGWCSEEYWGKYLCEFLDMDSCKYSGKSSGEHAVRDRENHFSQYSGPHSRITSGVQIDKGIE